MERLGMRELREIHHDGYLSVLYAIAPAEAG
jgi:hypothetical protein